MSRYEGRPFRASSIICKLSALPRSSFQPNWQAFIFSEFKAHKKLLYSLRIKGIDLTNRRKIYTNCIFIEQYTYKFVNFNIGYSYLSQLRFCARWQFFSISLLMCRIFDPYACNQVWCVNNINHKWLDNCTAWQKVYVSVLIN